MLENISYPGIGIVFNIEALGPLYGREARDLLTRYLSAEQLAPCLLFEGDTWATLQGYQNEYCIALFGPNLDLESIRQAILEAPEAGFAAFHRRLIESVALKAQRLVYSGMIDASGVLVTDEWSRGDHDFCKRMGWAYAPKSIPKGIDRQLLDEIADMRRLNRGS